MTKNKMLLDTCVWFDLAKTSKGERILSILEEFIEAKETSLIIPEIIITEYNRNKDRIINDAGKSLSNHFDKVKEVFRKHSDNDLKDMVISHLDNLNHKIPSFGEKAVESISRIEKLFSKSEILKITDEIKLRAVQRAIDKKAPFHLSKNSMGDALIIESYLEYKEKNKSQDIKLMFVTHNKNDFSLKNGNQKKPHQDFASIFDSTKSQYFINLTEALIDVNSKLIDEIEFINDWDYEPRNYSELREAEIELENKIWYNRHQIRAEKIKSGEIKIIDSKDFNIRSSNDTIVKEIWEGAQKSAKDKEDKYGKGNLIWDDFEWGMLNGKLSAIRWVIGEDWDELYT